MSNQIKSNGHRYNGRFNGRGQRQRSKFYKGIKVNFWKLGKIFKKIENEHKRLQPINE
jgi:hypothetical protein